MLAHLTNHAQQARGAAYEEHRHTRRLDEVFSEPFAASLNAQARAIAADAFAPFARGSVAFFALPHCFELYGVDLAVDENGRAWLLEVNSGPDVSLHGERLRDDADALLADALRLVTYHLFQGEPAGGAAAALRDADANPAGGDTPTAAVGDAFGGFECVLSRPCTKPRADLERFKRCMATIGSFAHSLHEAVGAPVRGVQSLGRGRA